MNKKLLLFIILLSGVLVAQAKTKRFGTWVETEISTDIFKKLEFSLSPEFRFQDDFSLDEYLIDSKLTYKPAKFLHFSGAYRFLTDMKKSGNVNYHRFAFDLTGKKEWNRFESSLRIKWTNYADFESENNKNNYLRYRLKFEYDLKNCKLRPFLSYELFHLFQDKELNKSRFDIGGSYKISKKSKIGAYYRLQSYFNGDNSIHIVGLEYKFQL